MHEEAVATPASESNVPRRLVAMNFGLGFYSEGFFPEQDGKGYQLPPYLQRLASHRDDFTIISGLYHEGVGRGHGSEPCIFTGTPNEGLQAFRNGISLDQLVAEKIGDRTRFDSLRLSHQWTRISWNRQGIAMPFEQNIQRVYEKLFGLENQQSRDLARHRLKSGRSILDVVGESARRMRPDLSSGDREKLEEYFESVRDVELRLAKEESWFDRPKPVVEMKPPQKRLTAGGEVFARMRMFFDLMHLALKTDSTRCIAFAGPTNDTITVPGETINKSYHNLTHHGRDPENIRQMMLIECLFMEEFNRFLTQLKESREGDDRLLDRTSVLLTSNLGNGAGHGCKNLPVLLAGGRFVHGQHLRLDPPNTTPLSNLYVSLLQELDLPIEKFSHSSGTLRGLHRTA